MDTTNLAPLSPDVLGTGPGDWPALPDSQSGAAVLPRGLGEQAAVVLTLARSSFYRHFLETFLEGAGRLLRVPWWGVHGFLYLATGVAYVTLVDVPRYFPNAGYISYAGQLITDFVFTTWMLWHLRECRSRAFLVAARIGDAKGRLTWLRKHLGPTHWGWLLSQRSSLRKEAHSESGVRSSEFEVQSSTFRLRVWQLTALVLVIHYGHLLCFAWPPEPAKLWAVYYPHLIGIYTHLCKAALMVTLFTHFWWLNGLMRVARGGYASDLSREQRQDLVAECRRTAFRLSVVVGTAASLWMLSHGLALGVTYWSYLFSLGLAALFTVQVAIIKDLRRRPFGLVEVLATMHSAFRPTTGDYRPAELFAVLASIACPVGLNVLGAFAAKLWNE